ncbi:MAG: hypothetical protein F6K54_31980 [Okeania sp. SIO3B5]|uniref:hypothetical protein n=1 Tax=Okeania sp. SIO3B5 TaxID=2607811 RepID=UPI0013FEEC9A|nr:hypothetical protein [Okeania sp. SIO3B5]NEO57285.1 hypothetical protein [Okeania sp. SIO3B5]
MNVDYALELVEFVLDKDSNFTDVQEIIFRECWQGRCSYQEIAKVYGYEYEYIKSTAAKLWKCLSIAFGEKVKKGNLRSVIKRYTRRQHITFNRNVFEMNFSCGAKNKSCQLYTYKFSTAEEQENKDRIITTPKSENNHNSSPFSKLSQSLLEEAETKIATALDSLGVTFFVKPNIKLTTQEGKCNLQPNFAIYYRGKLGIIEIDETEKGLNNGVGSQTEKNSDRLLQNTNIDMVKHYDDIRCFLEPDLVIKEFLETFIV